MYSLIVKHKGKKIIHKTLNRVDARFQWIVNSFKEYIGLDISSYRLDEFDSSNESFTIYIRNEDLEELRNSKLNNLGI
jgi:hypothetical protein